MRICVTLLLLTLLFQAISCKQRQQQSVNVAPLQADSIVTIRKYDSDTAIIKNAQYLLTIYRSDTSCYFIVEKEQDGTRKAILIEREFTTNNSRVRFDDYNHDGYADIIWTKKWQDHAYLFNPRKENFVEIGEYNHVDTLLTGKHVVYYQPGIPILYLINDEKEIGNLAEKHSELFVIDSNYHKISFATLDNFAAVDDETKMEQLNTKNLISISCHVPPYKGRWGDDNIWNLGVQVDSLTMPNHAFSNAFIKKYWQQHYHKLLKYGQVFTVRRTLPLEYPDNQAVSTIR